METPAQCIFCQIAQGKVNAQKVYEDSEIAVVLDINPSNPGHCLVITKTHYQVMPQIPDETVARMMEVVKKVSHAALAALKAQGTTIFVANGAPAGQRAPHFMLHVIPRVAGDGVKLDIPLIDYSLQEVNEARTKLQERILQVFEFKPIMGAMPKEIPEKEIKIVQEQTPRKNISRPSEKSGLDTFIWQKQSGPQLEIKELPSFDTAHVTRFFSQHQELLSLIQALEKNGPMHGIELQRVIDFSPTHLLALEYLGYIRILKDKEPLRETIDEARTKNHPGRAFYAITKIGKMLLEDSKHPPVLSNAVKEKILFEEIENKVQGKKSDKPTNQENFDLDRLTDLLGEK
ncbi:MAG: HIT family protein [Nanoarchaeota archaeon]